MTFSTRSSVFFFFTTLVLLSTQIHARDSYFFGKFHRKSTKDQNSNTVIPPKTTEKITVEESIPKEKEQEQDPTFVPESGNGYGLYGHNNQKEEFNNNNNKKYDDKFNGETFSTPSLRDTEESYNNQKEEFNNNNKYDEKFNGETFSTPSLRDTEESYNNYDEKYPKRYDNSGYNNEEFNNNKYDENVKEESFSENNEDKRSFYNSNAYGTELERETPYKGYSHNLERQGMSDTRFMEKGNYYYDLYNDRNHGHFYRKSHQKSPAGYYSTPTTESNYEQSYSYGKNYSNNNEEEEEEKSFKDPYDSKWEKNLVNEQSKEFVEEQDNHFRP